MGAAAERSTVSQMSQKWPETAGSKQQGQIAKPLKKYQRLGPKTDVLPIWTATRRCYNELDTTTGRGASHNVETTRSVAKATGRGAALMVGVQRV
jgi:hypothetical protein